MVRYQIQTSLTEVQPILVKIRHGNGMRLDEAIHDELMNQEARDEFEALSQFQVIFSRGPNAYLFFAIQSLALYDDLNALVMEEARLQSLKSSFEAPRALFQARYQAKLEEQVELAGRWLRIFHDQFAPPTQGPLFPEHLYEAAQRDLVTLQPIIRTVDWNDADTLLRELYIRCYEISVPYRLLHEDFHLANVFVDKAGRIGSFDPHDRPGPIQVDLAKFMNQLDTHRVQVATNGLFISKRRLRALHRAFLNGYFGLEYIDRFALELYRFLAILQKWGENETRLQQFSGLRKRLFAFGAPQLRHYYTRLLQERTRTENFGF